MNRSFDDAIRESYEMVGTTKKDMLVGDDIALLEHIGEVYTDSGYSEFSDILKTAEVAIDSLNPEELKNFTVYRLRKALYKILVAAEKGQNAMEYLTEGIYSLVHKTLPGSPAMMSTMAYF